LPRGLSREAHFKKKEAKKALPKTGRKYSARARISILRGKSEIAEGRGESGMS